MSYAEVEVGQVWRDLDKRMVNRYLRVIEVIGDRAICQPCNMYGNGVTHRTTKISLRRMKPSSTGFELVLYCTVVSQSHFVRFQE